MKRLIVSVLVVAGLGAAVAGGTTPIGPEFRVSTTGVDGDFNRVPREAEVAVNTTTGESMVVWAGDGLATDNESEVFAQRVSAAGTLVGGRVRVTQTGADGDVLRGAGQPSIAYNKSTNEYLVTWTADALAVDEDFEIFAQRFSAEGLEIGGDVRVSTTGVDGDTLRRAVNSAVTHNPVSNEYLVVWESDVLANDDFEIFAQRLDAAGTKIGGDTRVSTTGVDGGTTREASDPIVAHNAVNNEYLVAWRADALTGDNDFEILSQRISATGAELGGDVRVSTTGVDGDAQSAANPDVTYNAVNNEYLVAWEADGTGLDNKFEVFAQRVSGTGSEIGGDIRISQTGAESDDTRDAFLPGVAHSSVTNEYTVVWQSVGAVSTGELEIFGQRLTALGADVGVDTRITTTGIDGDPLRGAFDPGLAYNPVSGEHLVIWRADGLPTDNEVEIFARRLDAGGPPRPVDTTPPVLTFTAPTPQRVVLNRAVLSRARCSEACTVRVRVTIRRSGRATPIVVFAVPPKALPAATTTTVRAALSTARRRAITQALRAGRRVTITVRATATDAAGNVSPAVTRTVRVRR